MIGTLSGQQVVSTNLQGPRICSLECAHKIESHRPLGTRYIVQGSYTYTEHATYRGLAVFLQSKKLLSKACVWVFSLTRDLIQRGMANYDVKHKTVKEVNIICTRQHWLETATNNFCLSIMLIDIVPQKFTY